MQERFFARSRIIRLNLHFPSTSASQHLFESKVHYFSSDYASENQVRPRMEGKSFVGCGKRYLIILLARFQGLFGRLEHYNKQSSVVPFFAEPNPVHHLSSEPPWCPVLDGQCGSGVEGRMRGRWRWKEGEKESSLSLSFYQGIPSSAVIGEMNTFEKIGGCLVKSEGTTSGQQRVNRAKISSAAAIAIVSQ
ncbi:hypothetical protein TNCV_2339551 [Trichonephila clavipes]|nr:hypothetical protein TNCV_2339551 [Trichonephila clavipes]